MYGTYVRMYCVSKPIIYDAICYHNLRLENQYKLWLKDLEGNLNASAVIIYDFYQIQDMYT